MTTSSVRATDRRRDRPPFVLLHGGRHGGWCWRRVAPQLRARGHEVYTPTLTGLGERSHLLSPDIGLDTHIADIVGVFEYEDIADAIFVVHSYGGIPATGAMESIAGRVRTLVYLDALLPRSGQSMLDIVGAGDTRDGMVQRAAAEGEGWFIPPSDASHWGVTDPDDLVWVNGKVTSQPFKTYQDPVPAAERAWAHPTVYIECRPSTPFPLDNPRARAADGGPYRYLVIDAAHDVMVTAPDELTALLIEAIEPP